MFGVLPGFRNNQHLGMPSNWNSRNIVASYVKSIENLFQALAIPAVQDRLHVEALGEIRSLGLRCQIRISETLVELWLRW